MVPKLFPTSLDVGIYHIAMTQFTHRTLVKISFIRASG